MTQVETAPQSDAEQSATDPSEKREAVQRIASMLPEFDPAFVGRPADRLKEELNVQPPTEPPTGCDEIPTLGECKRIKALYPKIDLNHENLWYNVYDDFDATIGEHGWNCLLDVAEFVERWEAEETRKRNARATMKAIDSFREKHDDTPVATTNLNEEQPAGTGSETDAATFNLDDVHERVLRAAGLTQAAVLVEASLCNAGAGNVYGDPSDYFSAVVGTVRAANGELDDLLKLLDAKGGGA